VVLTRSLAEDTVRQATAANDQLTGEITKLKKDKQSLEQEVNVLREATANKDNQLYYKQRAIDTLRRESAEQQQSVEQMRAEKGVLQERIDEMEVLLRNAEAASEAAERRVTNRKQVLSIPFAAVQLSDKALGSGSFGGVRVGYWCGCPVAVKTLHEELAKELYQRSLFEQEVEVISRLHHPNIAAICGVVNEEDAPFSLIMELLQASLAGVIVAARVSGKYLTIREQTDVSHDCLSGLTYLHNLLHPVLHGDIRPTNILMTPTMRAKLGDLGAARFTDSSLSAGPMSPLYVAPERFSGHILRNSKEADIYSMGVTLCELFSGDQMDRVDRPRQLRSVHQRDLRIVCLRMAAENIQERMMASAALVVNDRALLTEKYAQCPPRRMVRGVLDGVDKVTLCDKPW
jgi:serine/threonine protein kinase